MKYKSEAPDMCFSGGKGYLPALIPPQPFYSLISSESTRSIRGNGNQYTQQRCKIVQKVKPDLVFQLQHMVNREND
ncbi:hypothetical protein NPIL_633121 [Nephila pilipes]|uniref:Uncharacterized protein n=1 Tax=Nephila pilipes TaxID=299642 RepID=A0A8X6PJZ3_NEPPI|nr:hypothetical protein NPIL_633121 [Nephila pilipes]